MSDNTTKMDEEGANERICKLLSSLVHAIEARNIGHEAGKLTRKMVVDSAGDFLLLERCLNVVCTLANRIPNGKKMLQGGAKDLLLAVVELSNPVVVRAWCYICGLMCVIET